MGFTDLTGGLSMLDGVITINGESGNVTLQSSGGTVTITTPDSSHINLEVAGGGGGITRSINTISSPTSAGSAANTDYVYLVSGTTTLTQPTAVGNNNLYTVKNIGVATVTIATTSAQTIDGSSTALLRVANTSLDLISDGTNWRIV